MELCQTIESTYILSKSLSLRIYAQLLWKVCDVWGGSAQSNTACGHFSKEMGHS